MCKGLICCPLSKVLCSLLVQYAKFMRENHVCSHSRSYFIFWSLEMKSKFYFRMAYLLSPCIVPNIYSAFHEYCSRVYSLKYHEFNSIKSSIVTYGESKPSNFVNMQERSWTLGVETVDELYEDNKNYCGSFNANINENIEKPRKKAGTGSGNREREFSAKIERRSIGSKCAYSPSYLLPRFSLSL